MITNKNLLSDLIFFPLVSILQKVNAPFLSLVILECIEPLIDLRIYINLCLEVFGVTETTAMEAHSSTGGKKGNNVWRK